MPADTPIRKWSHALHSHDGTVNLASAAIASCITATLLLPVAASAHENHERTIPQVSSSAASDSAKAEPSKLANSRASAKANGPNVPHLLGEWSEVYQWPILAIHANLLPTGDVLAWDATPDDFDDDPHTTENYTTRVTVWDPITNTHLEANNDTNADLFCAGSAQLWDGRVVFAGGDSGKQGRNGPLSNSSIYDPWTNTWTQADNLNAPRWYSSNVALSNGEILTFGGTYSPSPLAEVLEFNSKTWRPLSLQTQYTISGDYSWLQTTTSGDVMYLGPHNTLSTLETSGEGLWSAGPERDEISYRDYGSYAMYSPNRVIVAGGADSTGSASIVNLRSQTTEPAADMLIGRRQHNLTLLADGTVLATGGNSNGAALVDLDNSVLAPELWNPATDEWTELADMQRPRQYHSIALLLPDGRVLSAGGGYCGECGVVGYHEQNAEIFSPPYLFDEEGEATRPLIVDTPSKFEYGQTITVRTPDPDNIRRVSLIKLGSVTHSQNQEQRYKTLPFTRTANSLQVETPARRQISPPGHYLLFLINRQGVPSLGEIVQVGQPLIQSDDVVVNTLNPDRQDHYEIRGRGEHTLTVSLQGNVQDIDLVISTGQSPTEEQINDGFDGCVTTDLDPQRTICVVSAVETTDWYIGVKARTYERYSLLANVGTIQADVTLPAQPGSVTAPAAPVNLQANSPAPDQVALQWDEADNEELIHGYEVWRDGELHAFVDTNSFEEEQLQAETSYLYQVIAVDSQQNRSLISLPAQVETLASSINDLDGYYNPENPSAPTGLRYIEYSPTVVEFFWQPSFDNGFVKGYEVSRNGELVHSGQGVSYLDDTIVVGETYTYTVIAIDNEDNRSLPSNEVSIIPRTTAEDSVIKDDTSADTVDVDGDSSELLSGGQNGSGSGAALWILLLSALILFCRLLKSLGRTHLPCPVKISR